MDHAEYTSLAEAVAQVPDPRQARGKRYPWALIVRLIVAAMASGQTHVRAIAQWVQEHTETLQAEVGWAARLPSEATLRRALREMDGGALETHLAPWVEQWLVSEPDGLAGHALDGKWLRGTAAHGAAVQLLSLVRHDGVVRGQRAVAATTNEIATAPQVLAERVGSGMVITTDALLTQRSLAAQIVAQGGDYLLMVKGNQPQLQREIGEIFALAPWEAPGSAAPYHQWRSLDKGHGRLETRHLEATALLNDWLAWPAVGQVLKRTCRRVHLASGVVEEAVTYGVTSLPFGTELAAIAALWRGHWSIENTVHYVRDVTLRADAGQAYRGNTPHVLAALRNAVLSLLRLTGWPRIADALRHYGAHPEKALALVTAARL
jgi:predicted transposase YbfD/YdcC